MAGPIFAVSITSKSDTNKRWDLLSCWTDKRIESRLSLSLASSTDEIGGDNKYPMITLTDFLRGVAAGEGFFVDVRVERAAMLAWLQAAPLERSQPAPQPATNSPF